MRVSITGSRGLTVTHADIAVHLPAEVSAIVSGGAPGVDSVAASFARSRGITLSVIRPDYSCSVHVRQAPLARNQFIIDQADYCLIFWDGVSRGTKDTLARAVKAGKHGKVVVIGACVRDSVIRF
jgi:hypothetical protein